MDSTCQSARARHGPGMRVCPPLFARGRGVGADQHRQDALRRRTDAGARLRRHGLPPPAPGARDLRPGGGPGRRGGGGALDRRGAGRPRECPYVLATVEAMPLKRDFAFLAVDEIQLCADRERGHVFTHRLLHARGAEETPLSRLRHHAALDRQLVPEARSVTRRASPSSATRASTKLDRLPRRSAVVASPPPSLRARRGHAPDKGGAAVVLGALSPRTRNAQVAMYQSGEVEHLVATDAIGMGLNMDLSHVAFAQVHKFDGSDTRRLPGRDRPDRRPGGAAHGGWHVRHDQWLRCPRRAASSRPSRRTGSCRRSGCAGAMASSSSPAS